MAQILAGVKLFTQIWDQACAFFEEFPQNLIKFFKKQQ